MMHTVWDSPLSALPAFMVAVGAALLLWAVAGFNVARLRRARAALPAALAREGLTLVSARLCWLPSGPFSSAIARHQPVYRVIAQDALGQRRCGWIRCVPFSEDTEIVWR